MKKLLLATVAGLALSNAGNAETNPPLVATAYFAYKKSFELEPCLQHAVSVLNSFTGFTDVQKQYYSADAKYNALNISITCAYETHTVFFVISGPQQSEQVGMENIMKNLGEVFEPNPDKTLLRNSKARPGHW